MRANVNLDSGGGPYRRFRPSDLQALFSASPGPVSPQPQIRLAGPLTAMTTRRAAARCR